MGKEVFIVSACLAGVNCKYDGGDNSNAEVIELVEQGAALPVCPEQLGGLPTPREPNEIRDDRVVDKYGNDLTEQFERGAAEVARLAELTGARRAYLKTRSPSCGVGRIYDGTFTGRMIDGNGVAARLLAAQGVEVIGMDADKDKRE